MGTTKRNRSYDLAFKERAVKLSEERDNIKDLAAELGISPERIYKWRAEFSRHGEASFQGHGIERLSDEGKRVKELGKKLRNTELELDILKKAIAVFSKIDQ
jgi:transposase